MLSSSNKQPQIPSGIAWVGLFSWALNFMGPKRNCWIKKKILKKVILNLVFILLQ